MSLSSPFISRPVGTSLLTAGIALAGILAFRLLPVAPVPEVEFPTIQVHADLPGASPATMASAVATPLERQFGHIAGVTEMTSSSELGRARITLQFDLNRNVDAAGRDVQAAINAARGQLPIDLPSNPGYWKVNPADSPILILTMTSDTIKKLDMYDVADSILAQKIAQIPGIAQVDVGGSSHPAVRVEVNPTKLNKFGIGIDQVGATLKSANAHQAKGTLANNHIRWQVSATDQLFKAYEYEPLVVAYHNGAAIRVSDIAKVTDSVQDTRHDGAANGKPAILLVIRKQPGANIIDTVDRVKALLPQLRSSVSPAIHLAVVMDRTVTIRAAIRDVEFTLAIAIVLVVLVVFAFLRNAWATLIPAISVPVSLLGTFGVMYLLGYTLDNFSLMALTISTGFIVDDAIVVIENISRHLEDGVPPFQAALRGAKEIGFTVLTMSASLVAVFIPLLLMGGVVGRLFREFSVTLAAAITISMIVSLTTTPMMCSKLLRSQRNVRHGRLYQITERAFDGILALYGKTLTSVLRHPQMTLVILLFTIAVNVYLYIMIPKGFIPQEDTGRLIGFVHADQDISFQAMDQKLHAFLRGVGEDPAIHSVVGFTGGGQLNHAFMFMSLKPLDQRPPAEQVIDRLRKKLSVIPGATLYMQSAQDIRAGGRSSNAQYQYTLTSDNLHDLNEWAPKLLAKLKTVPNLLDVNSDQQINGLTSQLTIDRTAASRLGITPQQVDNTLYSAFGQRQVSTMYTGINQYHVVLTVLPEFQRSPEVLNQIYVKSTNGQTVPLSAFANFQTELSSLEVDHQGSFPAVTLSFALAPGLALSNAVDEVQKAESEINMPASVHGGFAGTAKVFQQSLQSEPLLILAAMLTVYIVLGMLYESYVHPLTILSTLPSAGVGALLALLIFDIDLSVIALIGVILLVGVVNKNAILMIDFALDVQRKEELSAKNAIYRACLLRFRPILMTTMATILGGLPLALGTGTGAELRRPLGVAIVGGLIVSQLLTLYTTPVVFYYLDRVQQFFGRARSPRLQSYLADNPN